LIQQSVIYPHKKSKDLQRDLVGGVVIDSSRLWHSLLEVGITARKPIKKQLLPTKLIKTVLQWAKTIQEVGQG
jgi:hypothetical protein